jgi:hypothetical protein
MLVLDAVTGLCIGLSYPQTSHGFGSSHCEATRIASLVPLLPSILPFNRCAAGPAMASLACSLSTPCTTSALRSTFQGDSLVDNAASSHQAPQPSKGVLRIEAKESRIGKAPIPVPKGVTINLDGQSLTVKGPLGELARTYPREVKLTTGSDGVITVERAVESRRARQMHGLFRWVALHHIWASGSCAILLGF